MTAKTTTSTTPSTTLPRRQQTEWFPRRGGIPTKTGGWGNLAVEQDPERARKLGNEIQDAGRRADLAGLRNRNEYARGLRTAADRFAVGVVGNDTPPATWIRELVQEIRGQADDIEAGGSVSERSNIRPGVLGSGTGNDRG